jgi:short subunit dehydrogenase-like uncharacterized protein
MKYDFIIFGASGYTGQYVVEFMANALKREKDETSTWAVSGRNESKLRTVLTNASKATGLDLSKIPIVVCNTSDADSIFSMASQARVVLNCVGPYRFHGEQVVAACVKAGANHVDISGEPQYLEKMQLKYNEEARAKGIFIIGACGFDSIPADMGQTVLADAMEGDVNSMETFLTITTPDLPGPTLNFATFQSAIYGFSAAHELKGIRKKLYPERLPSLSPRQKFRGSVFWSEEMRKYCMPFPGSDRSVMMRTQRSRFENEKERPTQIQCYFTLASLFSVFMVMVTGTIFGMLAKFNFGRYLLETYPGFFSFGAVSKDGPSKEMADNTNFELSLFGKGWKDKAEQHPGKPDREVVVRVSGKNVGYGATCEMLVQSAMVILKERDRMPAGGGVLTAGYAFAKTSLVERLTAAEVPFVASVRNL